MLLPLLVSAVVAAAPPQGAVGPAAPPAPAPSIDSLLQPPGDQSTDEDAGSARTQGPVPYGELNGKAYDDALKGAAAAARAAAGPLDGGWILADVDGRRLYRFQLQGRGYGSTEAEGAWRDLDGGPRLKGSGFVDQVGYAADQLTLSFHENGDPDAVVVTVKPVSSGGWSGLLRRRGEITQVIFRRDRG